MNEDELYESLGKMTEEVYLGLAKAQRSALLDQLIDFHVKEHKKITELIFKMEKCRSGEMLEKQQRMLQILCDDFSNLKNDIGSKCKIYIRGCGNAGKSTLLNALLSIDENTGSRMGRLPVTFTIDTFTDELDLNVAEVRTIDTKGKSKWSCVKRDVAISMEQDEEKRFSESKQACAQIIAEKVKNVYLEEVCKDIEMDVYKQNLMRTTIREIRWGIGKNDFFHNCVLIDTPGLSQELRFTNVIDDIKEYEVDGIVWVISSHTLSKAEVINAYQAEFKELEKVYAGKKVIAVINMYGTGEEYTYGSELWKRVKQRAEAIYCGKYGFSEVICVNAKLAYDGNLEQNQRKIDESNISELRKKINEMFIERASETYHLSKQEKIETFLDNLYQEVRQDGKELERKIKQYDDKRNKIMNLESSCSGMLKNELSRIASQHMADVRSNIESNLSRINNLENESYSTRTFFLEKTVVNKEQLEKRFHKAIKSCEDTVYQRFKEQQVQSIVSDFKTMEYAMESFQKLAGNMNEIKNKKQINIDVSKGAVIEIVEDIFGNKSIVTGVIRGIRDAFNPPKDRIYKSIKKSIDNWIYGISIDDEIEEYAKKCYETLEKSMEMTCGNYTDICNLFFSMQEFMEEKPHLQWEEVGLFDVLGGPKYV